jgi:hypothetical protein
MAFYSFRLSGYLAASAFGIVLSASALAADLPRMPTKAAPIAPAPVIDGWTFKLTPYAWAPSVSGSTTVKGFTTDVNASIFDIVEHTQFPKGLFELAASGEAWHGQFGLLSDILYMKLGAGASQSSTRDLGRLATLGLGVSAGVSMEMVIGEVAAAYEVARLDAETFVDVYAGGRAWWLRSEADFAVSGALTGLGPLGLSLTKSGTVSATGNVSWIDPLIGARLRHTVMPGMDLVVSGDVGGFDVGSRFSWKALAVLDYEFSKTKDVTWSGMIGYKALYADYSTGAGLTRFEYDMTMFGPVFGITARF